MKTFFCIILLFGLLFQTLAFAATIHYDYDDTYRITRVIRLNGTTVSYRYNESGNRISKIITIDTTQPGSPLVSGMAITNNPQPTWSWSSGGGGTGTFRYRLDNSDLTAGATETTNLSFAPPSALGDGTHTLYVQERDEAGNWSASGSFSTIIDTALPVVISGGNQIKNGVFAQTATATDAGAMIFAWSTLTGPGSLTFGSPNSLSTSISASVDGTYTIRFTATDAAGNISFSDMVLVWDTAVPTVAIGNPSSTMTRSGPVTYSVTYTGADTVTLTEADVILNKTGTANGMVAVSGTGSTSRIVTVSNIAGDGSIGISVAAETAKDAAANFAPAVGPSAAFGVDNASPRGTVTYSTTAPTNQDVIATLNPSEAVTVTNNGGFTTHTFAANGSFTFEFVDAAGNTGTATATVANIDKTAPSYQIAYAPATLTNQNVAATITLGEDGIVTSAGGNTHTFTENGTWTFEFADTAGNAQTALAKVDWIDKTPPSAVIAGVPQSPSHIQSATLTVGGAEVVQYKWKLNDGPFSDWVAVSQPITLEKLPNGNCKVSVVGKDEAGNAQPEHTPTVASWEVHPLPGDVDWNGEIDLADAILCLKIASGVTLQIDVYVGADVNENGRLGLEEAIYILREASGIGPR